MSAARPETALLTDGTQAQIRPVTGADHDAIREMLLTLSEESRYFRGCGILNVDWLSDWAVDVDQQNRYGALAIVEGRVVAHAEFARVNPRRAEVAFEVTEELQGHGLATILLDHLAAAARKLGITEFVAEVMPSNRKMLEVMHFSGYPIVSEATDGLTDVVIDISGPPHHSFAPVTARDDERPVGV